MQDQKQVTSLEIEIETLEKTIQEREAAENKMIAKMERKGKPVPEQTINSQKRTKVLKEDLEELRSQLTEVV